MNDHIETPITEADFAKYTAEDIWVEVIDGHIVEVDRDIVPPLQIIIVDNIYSLISPVVRANKLGHAFTDGGRYILLEENQAILCAQIPDVSFIRKGRIPVDFDWEGSFPGAPDFAVEVVSPGQSTAKLTAKIAAYLEAGTEEAWLIYPSRKEVHQFRREEQIPAIYKVGESIDMNLLFPDLVIKVADIFTVEN